MLNTTYHNFPRYILRTSYCLVQLRSHLYMLVLCKKKAFYLTLKVTRSHPEIVCILKCLLSLKTSLSVVLVRAQINFFIILENFQFSLFLFIYLGFYIAFNTVQVISQRVVGRAEETSTYSWSRFCTVNCRTTANNYQLSHFRPCWEPIPGLRGGRQECYHSATVAPNFQFR